MRKWKEFENESVRYLREKFGEYADFEWKGQSDSSVSDIEVVCKNKQRFFIEAKCCPAQCGQFVLFPNYQAKTFEYSKRNMLPINDMSDAMIKYMNENFDAFRSPGTKGENIDMPNGGDLFARWIIESYKAKHVRFVITNDNLIFKIEDIANAFSIDAKYRVKKSGSGTVAKKDVEEVRRYLKHNYPSSEVSLEGKKLFLNSSDRISDEKFKLSDKEYMMAERGENRYEIRKLSGTYNANVIFSVRLNGDGCKISDDEFISMLVE